MVCMLAEKLAAVCLDTTDPEIVAWLESKRIEIVPVSFRDTMGLGCNVVALGNDRVLSVAQSKELNAKLRALGFTVYDPDMSHVPARPAAACTACASRSAATPPDRMGLSEPERRVCDELERRRDELVELAQTLVRLDTTAREPDDPPRQERALQDHLAERLAAAGADVDLWEPSVEETAGRPLVPPGLGFEGRPQLVARFGGGGGGKSLLFNGHIDAVPAEPIDRWTSDPFDAEIRDGKIYGRGACDMKGGVAAMTFAAAVLAETGVRLDGDLVVATNTDEESSGAGGSAIVQRGIAADAGIVTEPTGFDTWVSCRGSEYGTITVPGKTGHAEVFQPGWRDGGAVNAIEKAQVVIAAAQGLRREWASRSELEHPRLSRPDVLPTMAKAGEWAVTYPSACELTIACLYLPTQADGTGWGADGQARGRGVDPPGDGRGGRLARRASARLRLVAQRRHADGDPRGRADRGSRAGRERGRRPAGEAVRARLVVRRRDVHAARGDPLGRVRAGRVRPGGALGRPHDRRVRPRRRPRRLRPGTRRRGDALLRHAVVCQVCKPDWRYVVAGVT